MQLNCRGITEVTYQYYHENIVSLTNLAHRISLCMTYWLKQTIFILRIKLGKNWYFLFMKFIDLEPKSSLYRQPFTNNKPFTQTSQFITRVSINYEI